MNYTNICNWKFGCSRERFDKGSVYCLEHKVLELSEAIGKLEKLTVVEKLETIEGPKAATLYHLKQALQYLEGRRKYEEGALRLIIQSLEKGI